MPPEATNVVAEFRICGDPSQLASVRERVRTEAHAAGFAEDVVTRMTLAVDEALSNVIRHGYGGPCDKPIDVKIERITRQNDEEIKFTIRDFGQQIDPARIAGRPLTDIKPGGLGVHIIKSAMDDVVYAPADGGGMRLVMRKKKPT